MLYFIFNIHLIMTIQNSSRPTKSKVITQEIIGNSIACINVNEIAKKIFRKHILNIFS